MNKFLFISALVHEDVSITARTPVFPNFTLFRSRSHFRKDKHRLSSELTVLLNEQNHQKLYSFSINPSWTWKNKEEEGFDGFQGISFHKSQHRYHGKDRMTESKKEIAHRDGAYWNSTPAILCDILIIGIDDIMGEWFPIPIPMLVVNGNIMEYSPQGRRVTIYGGAMLYSSMPIYRHVTVISVIVINGRWPPSLKAIGILEYGDR
ncbi:hypothetical protein H8356DRAFT_1417077 [Neocallimastix lanati (nom. inval.)]|nr:hypothetical protein H8356DRAFT_1417077 [Neocallimastix sp. JGI-2020a]